MITVYKTICRYESGAREINKAEFDVADDQELEERRESVREEKGCENVIFYYYETEDE